MKLTYVIKEAPEGGYVVYCPELMIVSQGESISEARDMIKSLAESVYEDDPYEFPREEEVEGRVVKIGSFFMEIDSIEQESYA